MADLTVDGTDVVVRFSALEALMALRREVRLPVADLHMVSVDETPLAALHSCRPPGLCWPGRFAVGSCHREGRRELVALHGPAPAVVLDAERLPWDRLVISHADAVSIAADLAGLLLSRGPGNPPAGKGYPAPLD
ncbi:MAG TPA: hypothetical protein VME46_14690 [Acidimicrobiales bacterium]|nr:hypothetical protein [Acidimicrobiales bacterium]